MEKVSTHIDKMECYACHADWAPQCYGCHVKVSYSVDSDGNPLMDTDWVATAQEKYNGTYDSLKSPGKVSESRGYLRWEEPVLGINGEGRVTPLIPGCQVVFTVIGPDGETLTHNEIGRTPPNTEGAGPEGQRGLDMAPVQPHTAGRQARTCESCHANPKALGYGIDGGRYLLGYTEDRYVDLENPDGSVMAASAQVQMPGIPDLPMDWSQIVDPETGAQLQTVGSHWPGSGPLTEDQRTRMERTGVCMGCHQNMADPTFWTDQVIAKFGRVVNDQEHIDVMNQVIQAAVAGNPQSEAAPESAPAANADAIATLEAQLSEAQAKLTEAEAKAAEAEAKASEAETKAAEIGAKATEVAAKATEAAASAPEPAAPESTDAESVAAPSAGTVTTWVLVALVLGILVGGGAVYFGRQKS